MARIIRSKPARADLRDIWLYIAQDNVDAADRFLDRIDGTGTTNTTSRSSDIVTLARY